MANPWKKVGTMRKNDKGNTYIKIDEDITLPKGTVLQVQDPRKKLDEAVKANRMSEEKAEEIRAKIPEWLIREIVLPPPSTK